MTKYTEFMRSTHSMRGPLRKNTITPITTIVPTLLRRGPREKNLKSSTLRVSKKIFKDGAILCGTKGGSTSGSSLGQLTSFMCLQASTNQSVELGC